MDENKTTMRDFLPLLGIYGLIGLLAMSHQWYIGFSLHGLLNDSMSLFFIIFGGLKLLRLHNFVETFIRYNLVAQYSTTYAYCYPFIELGLGVLYGLCRYGVIINSFTLILMIIDIISVIKALQNKKQIECACMGTVFKVPLTFVSLIEDCIMAIMAIVMLLIHDC